MYIVLLLVTVVIHLISESLPQYPNPLHHFPSSLLPQSPSPLSVSPHSPASPLEVSHEEEEEEQQEKKEVKISEANPKDLALAYGELYSPKISPGEPSVYQLVRNPFSLDIAEDKDGMDKDHHSEHKTVHFAESPSPERDRHLISYSRLDGSIYNQ